MYVYTIAPLVVAISVIFSVLLLGALLVMLKFKFKFKGILLGLIMIMLAILFYYLGLRFLLNLIL